MKSPPATKTDQEPLCIAVLHKDGSKVSIIDTAGKSRTYATSKISSLPDSKLCFSTHSSTGTDGFLTPCFDSNGMHGEPEEGCFCGVDTAHLHAHIQNPQTCEENDAAASSSSSSSSCAGKKKGFGGGGGAAAAAADIGFLAQLTLHPEDSKEQKSLVNGEYEVARIPVCESLPKECNSKELRRQLSKNGYSEEEEGAKRRKMYMIQHEDHFDYLVHNDATGNLHLEHPCTSCGETDLHGKLTLIGKRSWDGVSRIQLHFFEVSRSPFHLLDTLSDFFSVNSDRVAMVRDLFEEEESSHGTRRTSFRTKKCGFADCSSDKICAEDIASLSPTVRSSSTGQSKFFVEKICCASEIPAIKSLLEPLSGVLKVSINVMTKMVYVTHDASLITAGDICKVLNDELFGAHIKKEYKPMQKTSFVESTIVVSNLFYESDIDSIKSVLSRYSKKEIRSYVTHMASQTVKIDHNPTLLSASQILEDLTKVGLDAFIATDGAADGHCSLPLLEEDADDLIEKHIASVNPGVVLSGVFWVISMLSFIGGNWEYLKYVALLSVLFGLPPIALKSFRTLRRHEFDANCLMFVAAAGAIALCEFTEAAAVAFLFAISEWLETRATARARNALSSIVKLRPERANLIHPVTKQIVMVPAGSVAVGAMVSVRTGDKIPCDGVVREGSSAVDESSLTGESKPVRKGPGDCVSGGTINVGLTRLVVETTSTVEDSAVARLIRLVEEAQANRSPTEQFIDEFAKRYTPLVILAAICMCTIPWAFGQESGRFWTKNGLITIVIACPCALIISTPVTYVAGLAATAQRGVVVKGGAVLEALGQVNKICFDKTGTLTRGTFALQHLELLSSKYSRKEVLEYMAAMEAPSSHPIAAAIVTAAENENVSVPKRIQVLNHTVLEGEGLTAIVSHKTLHLGNPRLFSRLQLVRPPERDLVHEWAKTSATVGFLSIDKEIVAAYSVADVVRDEAREVVSSLRNLQIDMTMLTGDGTDAAATVGTSVGLKSNEIRSQLLPKDKLDFVSDWKGKEPPSGSALNPFKRRNLVLMCGDGVNDAPALAIADVGVAMGAGAALAMETSDVTLMDSNLCKLEYCLKMGRRVTKTINENIAFSLAAKVVVMGFTFAGMASLWAAIASDVGAMLIVTLNGMKLLPSKRKGEREGGEGEKRGDVKNGASGCATKQKHNCNASSHLRSNLDVENGACCKYGTC